MSTVTITEAEIDELGHKLKRLGLNDGERAFLATICELAARALENPLFTQGAKPTEFVIEKSARGKKSRPEFVVFRLSQFLGSSGRD